MRTKGRATIAACDKDRSDIVAHHTKEARLHSLRFEMHRVSRSYFFFFLPPPPFFSFFPFFGFGSALSINVCVISHIA